MYLQPTHVISRTLLVLSALSIGLVAPTMNASALDGPSIKTWVSDSQTAGPHTYRFEFILDRPAAVQLRYGTTIHLEQEVTKEARESHVVLLKNLEPSTRYFYQFTLTDANGGRTILPGKSFKTPASGPDVVERAPLPPGYAPVSINFSIPPRPFYQLDDWFFIPYQFSHKRDSVPNIRNVQVIASKTNARLSWETPDESYTPDVWYGVTRENQQSWVDVSQGDRKHFTATMEGLRPATTYFFHMASYLNGSGGTSISRNFSFTTPADENPNTLTVGDATSPRIKRLTYSLVYGKATLGIRTITQAKGALAYGTTRDFGNQLTSPLGENHSFAIDGLVPRTDYYAQLTLENGDGDTSVIPFLIKALGEQDQQKALDLPVRPKPKIVLVFSLDKKTITLGESTALKWSGSDTRPEDEGVVRCSASGSWGGNKVASWAESAETVTPLAVGTYTYTLTCSKDDVVAATKTLTLYVTAKPEKKTVPGVVPLLPAPSSILPPESTTAINPWVGQSFPPTSSSMPPFPPSFGPPLGHMNAQLQQQPGGQAQQPFPTQGIVSEPIHITFKITPAGPLKKGSPYTLEWTTKNAQSCIALGDWSGAQALNGTKKFIADNDRGYYLFCETPGKESKGASAKIKVIRSDERNKKAVKNIPSKKSGKK